VKNPRADEGGAEAVLTCQESDFLRGGKITSYTGSVEGGIIGGRGTRVYGGSWGRRVGLGVGRPHRVVAQAGDGRKTDV